MTDSELLRIRVVTNEHTFPLNFNKLSTRELEELVIYTETGNPEHLPEKYQEIRDEIISRRGITKLVKYLRWVYKK